MKTKHINNSRLKKSKIDLTKKILGGEYKEVDFRLCKLFDYVLHMNKGVEKGNIRPQDANTCIDIHSGRKRH